MKTRRAKRILVLLNQTLKAARDEISGILRASSCRPDFEVRVFDRDLAPDTLREHLLAWLPDGIITDNRGTVPTLLPGAVPNCLTFNLDRIRHIPVVYLDFSCPAATSVTVDDTSIGVTGGEFFLKRKYEHFAFVGTDLRHTIRHAESRQSAFGKTVRARGFACDTFTISENRPGFWMGELERLKDWIVALPKPCAVMAHADVYARLVNDACRLAKVGLPEQIALLGVDNEIDIADNLHPTLSSVLPDFENAGRLAVETLAGLVAARRTPRRPRNVSYGVKALIERGSTQDTHGANRLVNAARGLIAKRSHEGIRVADIARELHASERLLELHFQSVLGHTLRDELIAYRLNEVCKRLRETEEPIESITFQCGWRSSIALKLLFRRHLGMSMRDYRKAAAAPRE